MKKLHFVMGVLSGLVVLGSVSSAQAGEGVDLGARLGYGIPLGKTDGDSDMSDTVSGMIPLQLDIGYRVTPNIMVGGYLMYGFGMTGGDFDKTCDAAKSAGVDISCSVHDLRLGAQLQYHLMPDENIDPWLGAGIGYEWMTVGLEGGGTTLSATGHGFEFINLQGGADFSVAPNFGLGPFLSLSVGQYSKTSGDCSGDCVGVTTSSQDIDDKALHQWLTLGVRGTFVL